MKDKGIQEIIDMNYKVLFLLGYATSLVIDYKRLKDYHDQVEKCDWLIQAIQNVVYEGKAMPKIPY